MQSQDPSTLEDVYEEPYLLQQGLIIRTPQGRQAACYIDHLRIPVPASRLNKMLLEITFGSNREALSTVTAGLEML